jgi:hypothetical protein
MTEPRDKRASIRFGKRKIPLPGSKKSRVVLGSGLLAGGIVGFLPVVGFWMVPLGLMVLSVDSKIVRRGRRRLEVKWGRWRQKRNDSADEGEG